MPTILQDILFRFLPTATLMFMFVKANLTNKYKLWLQILIGGTCYYFSAIIGQLIREKFNVTSIDLLLMIIVLLCYCIFFHKERLRFKVFIAIATILSIITTEAIFSVVIFSLFPDINFQMGQTQLPLPAFIAINFEYVLCGFILYLITQMCKKFRLRQSFNKKAFIFMLFPLSQLFLLSAILKILIMNPENITAEIYVWIFLCVIISVISDIFSYRGLIQNSQLHETRLRNEQLEYERNAQYRYYEKISDMQHEIMKYRHDFKNALTTAYALCDNVATAEEGKKLLDELKKRNDDNKIPFFCANPIANTILWDKSKVAQEKGIELVCDVSLAENTGIDGVDLCSLIVNMLDNAIRGAEAYEGEKLVEIRIKEENDRIFMTVSNPADLPDFESSDRLPSTKNGKNHGYGTEIIKTIVARYGGDVLFCCKDKDFSVVLTLERPAIKSQYQK